MNKKGGCTDQIEHATRDMTKMTIILRRQLRKAVIDHISDSFLETNLPLENLIEAAKHGVEEKRYVINKVSRVKSYLLIINFFSELMRIYQKTFNTQFPM